MLSIINHSIKRGVHLCIVQTGYQETFPLTIPLLSHCNMSGHVVWLLGLSTSPCTHFTLYLNQLPVHLSAFISSPSLWPTAKSILHQIPAYIICNLTHQITCGFHAKSAQTNKQQPRKGCLHKFFLLAICPALHWKSCCASKALLFALAQLQESAH